MDKKNYVKPSMTVVKLKHRTRLLVGSDDPVPGGGEGGHSGHIPAMDRDDMNKLA